MYKIGQKLEVRNVYRAYASHKEILRRFYSYKNNAEVYEQRYRAFTLPYKGQILTVIDIINDSLYCVYLLRSARGDLYIMDEYHDAFREPKEKPKKISPDAFFKEVIINGHNKV